MGCEGSMPRTRAESRRYSSRVSRAEPEEERASAREKKRFWEHEYLKPSIN